MNWSLFIERVVIYSAVIIIIIINYWFLFYRERLVVCVSECVKSGHGLGFGISDPMIPILYPKVEV